MKRRFFEIFLLLFFDVLGVFDVREVRGGGEDWFSRVS